MLASTSRLLVVARRSGQVRFSSSAADLELARKMKGLGSQFGHAESVQLFANYKQQNGNTKSPELLGEVLSAHAELSQTADVEGLIANYKELLPLKEVPLSAYKAIFQMYLRAGAPEKVISTFEELLAYSVEFDVDSYTLANEAFWIQTDALGGPNGKNLQARE